MNASSHAYGGQIKPYRVYLTILAIVFVNEFVVMILLPLILPAGRHRWLAAAIDASLLTLLLVPLLWWTIIRPLRAVAAMRARLLEQFVTLQEEERRRIARDLHDEIGQSLTSVLMGLRAVDNVVTERAVHRKLADLRGIVNQAVQEVRRIANGLRPAALDHLGLTSALQRLAEDVSEKRGFRVEVETDLKQEERLPSAVQTAVYRIVQEALTNAARHAQARRIAISVKRRDDSLHLEVEDDGRGFSEGVEQRLAGRGPHLGLVGMAERTALLDGQFAVRSHPGRGTRIRATFPLRRREAT